MKVIDGGFGKQTGVAKVFEAITRAEKLDDYDKAFCIIKSDDYVVVSTNLEAQDLYFLLDQIKMSIITQGEYEI